MCQNATTLYAKMSSITPGYSLKTDFGKKNWDQIQAIN